MRSGTPGDPGELGTQCLTSDGESWSGNQWPSYWSKSVHLSAAAHSPYLQVHVSGQCKSCSNHVANTLYNNKTHTWYAKLQVIKSTCVDYLGLLNSI